MSDEPGFALSAVSLGWLTAIKLLSLSEPQFP